MVCCCLCKCVPQYLGLAHIWHQNIRSTEAILSIWGKWKFPSFSLANQKPSFLWERTTRGVCTPRSQPPHLCKLISSRRTNEFVVYTSGLISEPSWGSGKKWRSDLWSNLASVRMDGCQHFFFSEGAVLTLMGGLINADNEFSKVFLTISENLLTYRLQSGVPWLTLNVPLIT